MKQEKDPVVESELETLALFSSSIDSRTRCGRGETACELPPRNGNQESVGTRSDEGAGSTASRAKAGAGADSE